MGFRRLTAQNQHPPKIVLVLPEREPFAERERHRLHSTFSSAVATLSRFALRVRGMACTVGLSAAGTAHGTM